MVSEVVRSLAAPCGLASVERLRTMSCDLVPQGGSCGPVLVRSFEGVLGVGLRRLRWSGWRSVASFCNEALGTVRVWALRTESQQ